MVSAIVYTLFFRSSGVVISSRSTCKEGHVGCCPSPGVMVDLLHGPQCKEQIVDPHRLNMDKL